MRVLISTSTFPFAKSDGTPRFVLDLAEAISNSCRVFALVPDANRDLSFSSPVDVRTFVYAWPRSAQRLAYGHGMLSNLRSSPRNLLQIAPFLLSQLSSLGRLVKRERIDVVNSHWLVPQGLVGTLAKVVSPTFRHVLSVHASDVYLLNRIPGGRALGRFLARRADALLVAGSAIRDALDELVGFSTGAIVQPMGVHVDFFAGEPALELDQRPCPGRYLAFCGRLVEKKGLVHLLQAMPRIIEDFPDLSLVVVGYGPLEGTLRREANQLGIADRVVFVGATGHRDLARIVQASEMAVVPSVIDRHGETDGMPTVVVESMAAGVPVVGSAVDGIPDVIRPGFNGWLCRPGDPSDLGEKILTCLHSDSRQEFSQNARLTARQHDWQKVAETYLQAFGDSSPRNIR